MPRPTQEDVDYKNRISEMARNLAKLGADPEILRNMGADAESQYYKSRVLHLEEQLKQINFDYQQLLKSQNTEAEKRATAAAERDKLKKVVEQLQKQVEQYQQKNERLEVEVGSLKLQVQDNESKLDKVQRNAQSGASAVGAKEKQIKGLMDNIDKYRAQLQDAAEREKLLL